MAVHPQSPPIARTVDSSFHVACRQADVHPPKVETFDLVAMTNTDPKGFIRAVDEYRREPFGLYLARPMIDRPKMHYLESWLLPDLHLRITHWHFNPGFELDQDFYLDIATVEAGQHLWRSVDHYLDIVVRTGRDVEVVDTDELLAAATAGLIDTGTAQRALETTYRTVDKIASHGYDLDRWLSSMGIRLTWRDW